jgi:PAP2 superfamily
VVMFAVWLRFAFMPPPGVQRTRFFLTFMLLWMTGGGLLAVIFSSAGPCFYGAGHLGLSPDPYAPLMAYLRDAGKSVPIWALDVQQGLWTLHVAKSAEASVSAMPSMHNGSALLFALASAGWWPWIRRFLWAYVAVIFMGSIHLGYHYAVDSYVAWALTLAIWRVAGPVARRWEATAAATRLRTAFAESPASL